MPYSLTPLDRARVLVGDCCALVNEVIEGTRRQNLTALLAALNQQAVRLYVPRHVLVELERHIPEESMSRRRPVDPQKAFARWNALYSPYVRVVDVPRRWARQDARVAAVDARHSTDTPSAQLAAVIGPCWMLTEDPDLIANGFGVYDRLPLLLAAANEGELGLVERAAAIPTAIGIMLLATTGRQVARLPVWAQVGLVAGCSFLAYHWTHDGRLPGRLRQVFTAVTDLGKIAAPPLMTILTRHAEGQSIWNRHCVQPAATRTFEERVAAVLAHAPDRGLLARDIAHHLDLPVSSSVPQIRETLGACTAFVEVSRGRWVLGHSVTEMAPAISPQMIADWLRRAHRSN